MAVNRYPITLGDEVAETIMSHEALQNRAAIGLEFGPHLCDQGITNRTGRVDGVPIKINELLWIETHDDLRIEQPATTPNSEPPHHFIGEQYTERSERFEFDRKGGLESKQPCR